MPSGASCQKFPWFACLYVHPIMFQHSYWGSFHLVGPQMSQPDVDLRWLLDHGPGPEGLRGQPRRERTSAGPRFDSRHALGLEEVHPASEHLQRKGRSWRRGGLQEGPTSPGSRWKTTSKQTSLDDEEVVGAQGVERWHSVWAGWVQIPDRAKLFSVQNCCQSIVTDCGAFSNNV